MRTAFAVLFCSLLIAGCATGPLAPPSAQQGLSIQGSVHGGQQPIKGAHVYLFAANTTGYGRDPGSHSNLPCSQERHARLTSVENTATRQCWGAVSASAQ